MQAMKELAGAGRTVVAVIHQPRSSIFSMLDDLVLLSEGRTVFVGPAQDALAWFAAQGFVCPPGAAPSDYFLDTVAKVRRRGRRGLVGRASVVRCCIRMTNSPYHLCNANRTTAPPPWRP